MMAGQANFNRYKYSAQTFAYITKSMKRRLLALRQEDPRRWSESRVIGDALAAHVPKVEAQIENERPRPSHDRPTRGRRRAA